MCTIPGKIIDAYSDAGLRINEVTSLSELLCNYSAGKTEFIRKKKELYDSLKRIIDNNEVFKGIYNSSDIYKDNNISITSQRLYAYRNGASVSPRYVYAFVVLAAFLLHTNSIRKITNNGNIQRPDSIYNFILNIAIDFDVESRFWTYIFRNDTMLMALMLSSFTMEDKARTNVEKAYISLWLNKFFSSIYSENMRDITIGESQSPKTIEELLVKVVHRSD